MDNKLWHKIFRENSIVEVASSPNSWNRKDLYLGQKKLVQHGTGKNATFSIWDKNMNELERLTLGQAQRYMRSGWKIHD